MNKENMRLLRSMNRTQYYEFITTCLGMNSFVETYGRTSDKREIMSTDVSLEESEEHKSKTTDKRSFPKELAYSYFNGKLENSFLVDRNDYANLLFRDSKGNVFSCDKYFSDLDDVLLWFIIIGIIGFDSISLEDLKNNKDINFLISENNVRDCSFILGAGINFDFKIGDWSTLVNDIKDATTTSIGCSDEELKDLETALCNTNYIAPQILKDHDQVIYRKTIYNSLYNQGYKPSLTDSERNSEISNTNLYQIARIASSQNNTTKVLTFNYDDVLETLLGNSFKNIKYHSVYKRSRSPKEVVDVEIIHSHGFMPFESLGKNELVFSSFEYMEAYRRANSYARKKLIEQLKQTNLIIGNSLSDYEEQKVFFANHKSCLSHYDYMLAKRKKESWMNLYLTIYFLKMGVIPIFFNEFSDINDFLKRV